MGKDVLRESSNVDPALTVRLRFDRPVSTKLGRISPPERSCEMLRLQKPELYTVYPKQTCPSRH